MTNEQIDRRDVDYRKILVPSKSFAGRIKELVIRASTVFASMTKKHFTGPTKKIALFAFVVYASWVVTNAWNVDDKSQATRAIYPTAAELPKAWEPSKLVEYVPFSNSVKVTDTEHQKILTWTPNVISIGGKNMQCWEWNDWQILHDGTSWVTYDPSGEGTRTTTELPEGEQKEITFQVATNDALHARGVLQKRERRYIKWKNGLTD
jgi:hypothetical protein